MRWAVPLVALLLPGCLATFEGRFEQGLQQAHLQGSPAWRDPGLYDALPDSGDHEGFTVRTDGGVPMQAAPAGTPVALGFRDAGLDAAYGAYTLKLVRWREAGDGPARAAFHLDPESLQGWVGEGVGEDGVRARFRIVAPAVLDVPEAGLQRLEDEFVASRRAMQVPAPEGSGTAAGIAGFHHIVMAPGPPRVAALFGELGGLPAFEPVPRHQALFLGGPGQVDLVQGPWEFALDTPLKVLVDGPFADRDGLLVAPDDSVMYVHWGEEDLSDREAAAELRHAVRRLGREPPDTAGWTFTREDVQGGPA